jgi:hypothetical protein
MQSGKQSSTLSKITTVKNEDKEDLQLDDKKKTFEFPNPNLKKRFNFSKDKESKYEVEEMMLETDNQKRKLTFGIVMRFYWMWIVLFFVHFWIFYQIPRTSYDCKYKKNNADILEETKVCSF